MTAMAICDDNSNSSSAVRLRSIYVSQYGAGGVGDDALFSTAHSAVEMAQSQSPSTENNGASVDQFLDDQKEASTRYDDEEKNELIKQDPIMLPQSTYTLLFTTCGFSLPFWFAFGVCGLSLGCLALAFYNNLLSGSAANPFNIPANVDTSVRIAQYLSIFIGKGQELLKTSPREFEGGEIILNRFL